MNYTRPVFTPKKSMVELALKEALDFVAKNYTEGFVEYWDGQKNNEWQHQLDFVEKAILQDSDGLALKKIQHFKLTAELMLESYGKMKRSTDAFYARLGPNGEKGFVR